MFSQEQSDDYFESKGYILSLQNKKLSQSVYKEFVKASRFSTVTHLLVALGIMSFFRDNFFQHQFKIISIIGIIAVSSIRFIYSFQTQMEQSHWMRIFSVLLSLTSVLWAVFFTNLAVSSQSDMSLLLFSFLGPVALCAGSLLTMTLSRMNSLLFQTPMMGGLVISFGLIFGNTPSAHLGIFTVVIFWFHTSAAQENWNATWSKLQIYNTELQSIIDSIPGGLSVVKNGCYSKMNSYFKESLSFEERELKGCPIELLNTKSDFTKALILFSESDLIRSQREFILPTALGDRTHYVIFQKVDSADVSSKIIISTFDIEDLKNAQKDLELQRTKMEYNAKMASLGEMSSGLAHEINNPLAVISARAQILQGEFESGLFNKDKSIKSVETIMNMTYRISKIIKSLKLFARDTSTDSFEEASLTDIINETVSLCEIRSTKYEAHISKRGLDEDIRVECLPSQISQVLLNAFNNFFDAITTLKEKWIQIEVVDEGSKVRVEITDSGGGIPEAIQAKVMLPFFTTKEAGNGTGLGMSLSKGIIDSHRGEIFFDHQSKNTKLVVVLPKTQIEKVRLAQSA